MSAADREDNLQYLNALWLSYRTAVAEARPFLAASRPPIMNSDAQRMPDG